VIKGFFNYGAGILMATAIASGGSEGFHLPALYETQLIVQIVLVR
jgi:hypothetical protein